MDAHVSPPRPVYERQLAESGDPHHQPAVMEELKAKARDRGLWNLFHPDDRWGAGPLQRRLRAARGDHGPQPDRARRRATARRPDTGNMEVLTQFGTPEQQDRWLRPLLDGEIRSAFAMTEPDVASSDATNIQMRIERDGDDYVLNGRKWWTPERAPALPDPHRDGQDRPRGPAPPPAEHGARPARHAGRHRRARPAGLRLPGPGGPRRGPLRGRPRAGREPHRRRGRRFPIAQARLGPGRIHHCMRAIGAAERALELHVPPRAARA